MVTGSDPRDPSPSRYGNSSGTIFVIGISKSRSFGYRRIPH
jgi:hypothetical protein